MIALEFPFWDPVLLTLPWGFGIRWYGIMWIAAFVSGYFVLCRLAASKCFGLSKEQVPELMILLVIGSLFGGRLGYWLFYDHSVSLMSFSGGGMSYHGGILGVSAAIVFFAWRNGLTIRRVGDAVALGVPIGTGCVRIANFINAELYGRVTTESTFAAMRFPTDPLALSAMRLAELGGDVRLEELAIQAAVGKVPLASVTPLLPKVDTAGEPIEWAEVLDWSRIQAAVPFRHPSQLYEALGEGLLLGLVLWWLWRITRARPLGPGGYAGAFFVGYGLIRFAIEFLRQPDEEFATASDPLGSVLLGLSMGQVLCAVVVLGGLLLLALARKTQPTTLRGSVILQRG